MQQFILIFFSDTFPIVHFLPFFPYSSDDGFSVIDYEQVNPEIGDWADVQVMSLPKWSFGHNSKGQAYSCQTATCALYNKVLRSSEQLHS